MKAIRKLIFLFCFMGTAPCALGQDSLSAELVKPLSHLFSIADDELTGAGADFLRKEIANAQFTLLGDYADSKSSSDLTAALLPILDRADYATMALGIGPPSARLLNSLKKSPATAVTQLRDFNNTYAFTENEKIVLPMPDMKSVSDARFIQRAAELQWSIVGFGNESWNNLPWLLDQLYETLPQDLRLKKHDLYKTCKTELEQLYVHRNGNLLSFTNAVKNSIPLQNFLETAREASPAHADLVDAFANSVKNSDFYARKRYYDKNHWRVNEEKRLLGRELKQINFDIRNDRLFVKWDLNFLSRGFQPYAFYGLGNTLSELAEFNQGASLHIGIVPRYQRRNGSVVDLMTEDNTMAHKFAALLEIAKKHQWTVIDLRPMIKGAHYAPIAYLLDAAVEDLIKRYDLIVIPAVEDEMTLNYDR